MVNSASPVKKSEGSVEWVRSEYATYGVKIEKREICVGSKRNPSLTQKNGSASSEELAGRVSYLRVSS